MNHRSASILTHDETVFARFKQIHDDWNIHRLAGKSAIARLDPGSLLIIDSATPELPVLSHPDWSIWCKQHPLIIASSAPDDDEGLRFLELGASGYCHAYASSATLQQVLEVVANGEQWVGRSLLSRLLQGLKKNQRAPAERWASLLSEREAEVARLAAAGESNLAIAVALNISERTVKAHLTSSFEKLGVTDRLQLALKVHGIHM